jgi:subtilisin family serine protease
MKKIFLPVCLLAFTAQLFAQSVDQAETEKRNWFHSDFAKTGIYGVGTDSALEFLESKGLKPTPVVVGVLDSGVEIDHEDLKNDIWTNPKEKPGNGKDDDKNGFVDDIHGWDFCAGANDQDYKEDSYEATRVVVQFTPMFNSGNKKSDLENIKKHPAEYQMFLKAKKLWADKYYSAKAELESEGSENANILAFLESLKTYTKGEKLTTEYVAALPETNPEEQENKSRVQYIIDNNPEFAGMTMDEIIAKAKEEFDSAEKQTGDDLKFAYNTEYNPAKGKFDKKVYGNNEVEGPDAFHGTHVSGIIGAERGNGIGMDGVAGGLVKIMSVRTVPDGDERDEDVAAAIRYAADNGAKILNMSFGKPFSPKKDLVYEAIQYASQKGVLMFHAAGNDNKDLDYETNYPSNYKDNEMQSIANNWVTVGASTRDAENLKASFSNFGTVKVDLYAPGTEIYSTVPDQNYKYAQGTSMASPVAAGCAALLWAYFPDLTAEQVKEILFETVNKSDVVVKTGSEDDERKFSNLSETGGVIDVNKAVRLAYEKYGKK